MAAKKKPVKKSTTRRPSISRAKPTPKPCSGRIRGHAPDCNGEAAEPAGALPGEQEVMEATGADVVEQDEARPESPYLNALQSIASSLEALAGLLLTGGLPTPALVAPEAPRKPRKAKEAPPAAEPTGALPGLTEAAPAAPAAPSPAAEAVLPCCGATVASGIHKIDCSVKYPKAPFMAPPATPPAAVSVEELRSTFLSYASRKGRDEAVALLQRFGVAKVGDLPAAQWPALLGAMKGA